MTSTVVQHADVDPLLLTRFDQLRGRGKDLRIVLPEGGDQRVREAARILRSLGAEPLLVGCHGLVPGAVDIDLLRTEKVLAHLQERLGPRGEHALTAAQFDPLALAMAAVAVGESQAVVAGATCPTADVMRTAFRMVGPATAQGTISSSFLMRLSSGDYYAFGDCAVIPDPTVQQLAHIATATADTYQALTGNDPRVAMLSFSTAGSAEHPSVQVVREATETVRTQRPDLCIDGELQFDAAADQMVAAAKAPDSAVAGRANVFIFPNLAAGNIGYKITQRLAAAQAYGPILQGLAAPVNDLSRGTSITDIVNVSLISLVQSESV
ncbi:phosphate acyltransferase [Glutamicibacter sp.]|uniref:phosphate acyltransferase n=1 Tax=Glutamicibacter sp. TaxID=1931995 RepID=UPI0028BD7EA8|nr:phosphate acyltransferase [Glutamicibacter sp.]